VALVWLWCECQILDFQGFANIKQVLVSQRFHQHTPKGLSFNIFLTSFKRLSFNAFTHLFVLGGWVKGRVLSKG
jgi:hypothetical protein